MNHVLKHSIQWRPQQLPALIAKISAVVDAQHIEADRALCGRGKFMLAPSHAKGCSRKKPHPPGGWQSIFFREGGRFVYCTFPVCVLATFHSYSGMGGVCALLPFRGQCWSYYLKW